MKRTLGPLEKISDVVQVVSGSQVSEITGSHPKPAHSRRRSPAHQTTPDSIVNDVPERPARTSGFGLQFRSNIIIQG
jgi:hypothetical protein